MGDLRPDNGGDIPPEDGGGARNGDLPGFPAEWGTIVIPDDAAELDSEAAAIRRELRREHRRYRLRSAFGLSRTDGEGPSLGVPVVVMAVAVITTLLSLFVVTWDRTRVSSPPPSGNGATPTATALVDVVLADAGGDRVRLGNLVPAVLLLAEGCDCADLIAALAAAAPPPVTIVPIGRIAPCPVGSRSNVRCLADPEAAVTARWPSASTAPTESGTAPASPATANAAPSPTRQVSAVLVDSSGTATAPITIDSADDLAVGLANLGG
jgi:hypothetical protein